MREQAVAFWLVPAEPTRSELAALIERLRVEQAAPVFLPHITLFVQDERCHVREPTWEKVLERAAAGIGPLQLEVSGIGHSEQLFKTLYIEVKLDDALRELHARLSSLFAQPSEYLLKPHLSLLYKELPSDARERLARSLQPPATFACDRIAATTAGPDGWLDIASWTEICSTRLG